VAIPDSIKYGKKEKAVNFAFNGLDFALEKAKEVFAIKKIKLKNYKYERTDKKYELLIELA